MYQVSKRFSFDAAHHLLGLPPHHKCSNVHGHTYTVKVVIAATRLDETGFVIDFGDLQPFKRYIDKELDHTDLNDLLVNPTSENLAHLLYQIFSELVPLPKERVWLQCVRVSETPNTWAEYSG